MSCFSVCIVALFTWISIQSGLIGVWLHVLEFHVDTYRSAADGYSSCCSIFLFRVVYMTTWKATRCVQTVHYPTIYIIVQSYLSLISLHSSISWFQCAICYPSSWHLLCFGTFVFILHCMRAFFFVSILMRSSLSFLLFILVHLFRYVRLYPSLYACFLLCPHSYAIFFIFPSVHSCWCLFRYVLILSLFRYNLLYPSP